MVRTTELIRKVRRLIARAARGGGLVALICLIATCLFAIPGCSGGSAAPGTGSSVATQGAHMAGPAVDVNVSQAAIDARPKDWDLTTPESAVRSYLDWTSYAYSIDQSFVATATMTVAQEVRVDSYVQYNIQEGRLLAQDLESIVFGKQKVTASKALVPTTELWNYSYLSIAPGNKVLGGPYTASYDVTYTVVKQRGIWLVDSVDAKPKDTVK